MTHLSLAGRSRTVLLVVIGVLLVPTVALGARAISGWQAGSVVVRKIGPLPTYSWVLTGGDVIGPYDQYVRTEPLALPPVNLGGAIASDVAMQTTLRIPQEVIDGLAEVLAGTGTGGTCSISVHWSAGENPFTDEAYYLASLWWFYVRSSYLESDLAALFGPHTRTVIFPRMDGVADALPEGLIRVTLGCYEEGTGPITPDLGTSPITLSIDSVRVLAF